jgi:lactaldehyde dehydrogenase/glycolaldehyde dehydrogenase
MDRLDPGFASAAAALAEQTLYIDGQWARASGDANAVVDPASESVLANVPAATGVEVDRALRAAQRAKADWARLPAASRGEHLRAMADAVASARDDLARLLVHEVGKPLAEARGEVDWAVSYLRYTAEWDRRLEGEAPPSDNRDELIQILRVPHGVVAAICPWNYPVALFVRKAAPALLTGNTVVVKPSELTPLGTLKLVSVIDQACDLPSGVLNVVTGAGDTGRALAESPLTNMVTMTGHRDTGKKVMAAAAQNLTRVSLELGGHAPAIVCADANLPSAVRDLIIARHSNAGQVCTCAERVLVEKSIYAEFVDAYCEAVLRLRVGDPLDDVDLGPLVSANQLAKAERAVELAVAQGAHVVVGGNRPEVAARGAGYWYSPTVLTNVRDDMEIMREEVFAPVTPIMEIESFDEGLRIANASRDGLTAYVFTRDYRTAMRAATEVAFGELYINRTHGEALQGHHVGLRESGLGGEDGRHGIEKYQQLKTVYMNFSE